MDALQWSHRVLVFAHRGASYVAPENTLAAFQSALEVQADGIELDVQLSWDGHPVVIHDFSLEATTNGRGWVRQHTLDELKALDAGAWKAPAFVGQQIPTLGEVLDVVGGSSTMLNVELKTTRAADDGLAAVVAHTLAQAHLATRVLVSSFNPVVLWRFKRHVPQAKVGLLYTSRLRSGWWRTWARHLVRPQALHPHHSVVNRAYVGWAHKKGYRLNTWTVDEPQRMRELAAAGVDMIITNRPRLAKEVLDSGRTKPGPSGCQDGVGGDNA